MLTYYRRVHNDYIFDRFAQYMYTVLCDNVLYLGYCMHACMCKWHVLRTSQLRPIWTWYNKILSRRYQHHPYPMYMVTSELQIVFPVEAIIIMTAKR